jgi:hypothetical protein
MRRRLLVVPLAGMACLLAGCAEVIPWLINPAGAATATATAAASSITQVDPNTIAAASTGDIDRILAENPDAVNAAELRDLRSDMASLPLAGKGPSRDDVVEEYRRQFDRRAPPFERQVEDKLIVRTQEQFQQPYGIRATPLSHLSNESLPEPQETQPILDLQPVRFGGH